MSEMSNIKKGIKGFDTFLKNFMKISNISEKKARVLIENFGEAIKETLLTEEIIRIKKFGSFLLTERKEWIGTLPGSGDKKRVKFSATKTLRFKFPRDVRKKLLEDIEKMRGEKNEKN